MTEGGPPDHPQYRENNKSFLASMGACNLLDYGQLTTVKRCIRWPESHDRMAGLARPAISFELIADLSFCFQLVPKGHVLSQVMGSWWSVDLWISLQWFQVHCSTNWDGSFAFSCLNLYIILLFLKYFSFSDWRKGPDLFFSYKSLIKIKMDGVCLQGFKSIFNQILWLLPTSYL